MRLLPEDCRQRFAAARIARLATVSPGGAPHLVPITFAVVDEVIAFAIDDKPKSTRRLQRLKNIAAHPLASFLVDEYTDSWAALWWVRADARARIVSGGTDFESWLDELAAKYSQYRQVRPTGPIVMAEVESWSGWSAAS